MRKKLVSVLVPFAVAVMPATALAGTGGMFDAALNPVPHAASADGGSNVTGNASLKLSGRMLTVNLKASGLTPNEPHAMHIHGVLDAVNECPSAAADVNTGDPVDSQTPRQEGTPDGLVSLTEGAPFYGPVQVSFTTSGDTTADSTLSLERFPVADANGNISYQRTIEVPKNVAKSLSDLHIVVHGADLPADDNSSSLSSLFEATLPVACGHVD